MFCLKKVFSKQKTNMLKHLEKAVEEQKVGSVGYVANMVRDYLNSPEGQSDARAWDTKSNAEKEKFRHSCLQAACNPFNFIKSV